MRWNGMEWGVSFLMNNSTCTIRDEGHNPPPPYHPFFFVCALFAHTRALLYKESLLFGVLDAMQDA